MMGCVCHLRIYNTVLNVKFNFSGELRVFVHFMCVCVCVCVCMCGLGGSSQKHSLVVKLILKMLQDEYLIHLKERFPSQTGTVMINNTGKKMISYCIQ